MSAAPNECRYHACTRPQRTGHPDAFCDEHEHYVRDHAGDVATERAEGDY